MTETGADNENSTGVESGGVAGDRQRTDNAHGRGPRADPVRALVIEGEAARVLLHNLHDVLIDHDDDAVQITIESETNLVEAITCADELLAEMLTQAAVVKQREEQLRTRRERLENRAELVRAAIQTAMEAGQLRKLVLPTATLSLKAVPPKVVVIDEASIPSNYFKRADPTLDKRALLEALKYGTQVPGAELSNGSETLARRT